jgi:hypothetical protein
MFLLLSFVISLHEPTVIQHISSSLFFLVKQVKSLSILLIISNDEGLINVIILFNIICLLEMFLHSKEKEEQTMLRDRICRGVIH